MSGQWALEAWGYNNLLVIGVSIDEPEGNTYVKVWKGTSAANWTIT